MNETYLGSTVSQYLLCFAIVGAGALLVRTLRFVYERRIVAAVERNDTELDDVVLHALGRPVVLLGVVLAVFVGREVLTPAEPLRSVLAASIEIPVIVALAWIAVRLTDGLIETYLVEYADRTESKLDDELVPIASRMTNIAIATAEVTNVTSEPSRRVKTFIGLTYETAPTRSTRPSNSSRRR